MIDADLREAVARMLCDHHTHGNVFFDDEDERFKSPYLKAADDAIALVVARCAEVADAERHLNREPKSGFDLGARAASENIAEAIRALAQEPSHER